jgi:hypothetical protein
VGATRVRPSAWVLMLDVTGTLGRATARGMTLFLVYAGGCPVVLARRSFGRCTICGGSGVGFFAQGMRYKGVILCACEKCLRA